MASGAKLRVLYGVHGYGRGHAARAQAVLPELVRHYDVLVLAGDEAYDQLRADYRVVRIPSLRYCQDPRGRRSAVRTILHNLPGLADLLLGGPALEMVISEMRRFGPRVVLSDSEGWTHRAARRLGIPRISFDHYGVLLHGRADMPATDRVVLWLESLMYRFLICKPERTVAAAFFPAEPRTKDVRIVGPIIRAEARRTAATDGEYLLAYFSNARANFTPQVEQSLRQADCPVKLYGPDRRGNDGNLEFCPIANEPFLADLAGCRAVVATAGNQLISEAIHFGKPLMVMPEDSLEQRLNARIVARWRIGMQTSPGRLPGALLREFLVRHDELAANIRSHQRDGLAEALDAIREAAAELAGKTGR
jgi:uncharacterized protein (TIGR00661 family)